MMVYIPWVICSLLCILFIVSLYYNIKFAKVIFQMEDDIGECLDILDEKYRSLSKILEIPIFFDSPQVRQVVQDIKAAKGSLLYIANRLSSIEQLPSTEQEQEESINAESKKNS